MAYAITGLGAELRGDRIDDFDMNNMPISTNSMSCWRSENYCCIGRDQLS